jgi:hypothetical protein
MHDITQQNKLVILIEFSMRKITQNKYMFNNII